jgi:DNA-binding transcriptional LysR family regulator
MLDLQALQYFCDCYRLKSMSDAARSNHVSRPAISHAVKRLEESLGVALIHHKRRCFELTEAGHQLGESARQLFQAVEEVESSLAGHRSQQLTGVLRLGIARVLATFRCDDVLMSICTEHPHLRLRINLHNSEEILDLLAARQLDAALVISDETRANTRSLVLYEGSFVLAKPRTIPTKDVRYATTEWRNEIDAAKSLYRKTFRGDLPVFAEIPSWDTIWNWMQKGYCGGLIPDLFLHRTPYRDPDLAVVLRDVHPYAIRLVFNESQANKQVIRTLARELETAFSKGRNKKRR